MTKASGVSRNIPAAERSEILEICSEIAKWPGYREIRARVMDKRVITISYEGQAGYLKMRLKPGEDFVDSIGAIRRKIEEDKAIDRIRASWMTCDRKSDENRKALWRWLVPEGVAAGYRKNVPQGMREYIKKSLIGTNTTNAQNSEYQAYISVDSESDNNAVRRIKQFSLSAKGVKLFYGSTRNQIVIPTYLPSSYHPSMPGEPVGRIVSHPLISKETIITEIRALKGGTGIGLEYHREPIENPPITKLEDVLAVMREDRWHE